MDESLYKFVVGYVSIDTISQDETLKNPYIMIIPQMILIM